VKILALEGALGGFAVAVRDGERSLAEASERPDALESGLGRVAALLARAGIDLGEIDRLAVGIGPGSFTGVRIAVSFAKAIALARGLPLVAISSYDILTPDDAADPVLTVVRGRRGIVSARLRNAATSRTASGTPAAVLDALLGTGRHEIVTLAGNTEDVRSAVAERGLVVRALPDRAENPAAVVARLAVSAEPSPTPHAVTPDYGELPAVTIRPGT
jgi:tRNA threonylcarbamoyl adenosine modification protein YeaZ